MGLLPGTLPEAIQARIACPIHFAQAACAYSGFYTVRSELLSGRDLRGRWNQLGGACPLPRGKIQNPFARGPLREQRFNAASHLGIRIRQQRLTLFAGFFQRGVVKLLHPLPVFRVRLSAPAIRVNGIARSEHGSTRRTSTCIKGQGLLTLSGRWQREPIFSS